MAFSSNDLKRFGKVFKKAFMKDDFDTKKDVYILVKLAEIARTNGFLAIENYVNEHVEDTYLKEGIMLILDGSDEQSLRDKLEGETFFMKQRHQKGAAMMDMLAATAPALGLLGHM